MATFGAQAIFVCRSWRAGIVAIGLVESPDLAPDSWGCQTPDVAQKDVDNYLASVEQPQRSSLEALRRSILDVVPDAEQCISYGVPAFKVEGKTVAGFAAFKGHLSYLPHSGSVIGELGDDLAGYRRTKGTLHFPVDQPLPGTLVRRLVEARLRELGLSS